MYRDLEMSAEAIGALDKSIRLMERLNDGNQMTASNRQNTGNVSMVSGVAVQKTMDLERTGIMKILAEEQIKVGHVTEGI